LGAPRHVDEPDQPTQSGLCQARARNLHALRRQMISRRASRRRKKPPFAAHSVARCARHAALRCNIDINKDVSATFESPAFILTGFTYVKNRE
jgi:hypothetical protein